MLWRSSSSSPSSVPPECRGCERRPMTTHAKAGDCVACRGTDDGGFRGYCGIPAWLGCGGAGVILRLCCLQNLLMIHNMKMKKGKERKITLLP